MDRIKAGSGNKAARLAWVKEAVGRLPAGSRILDAGAGELLYKQFCGHLSYVSQDLAEYEGKGDGSALQSGQWDASRVDIVSDITSIPEPDASFDAVMCIEVLEHLPRPVLALAEFARLLTERGWLILTAPVCSLTHQAPHYYNSGFSRHFYVHHLKRLGFSVVEITPNGNYFEYMAQEVRRLPHVASKYAGTYPGRISRFIMSQVLRMLDSYSKRDRGSDELLCYGYHVLAKKQGNGSQ